MLAHVDTGVMVVVSNIHGERRGVTSRCGTVLTSSTAIINALGSWMIEWVGSVAGSDLSLALRGTTHIINFQQCSLVVFVHSRSLVLSVPMF